MPPSALTGGVSVQVTVLVWPGLMAAKLVGDAAHPDANIIFGANVDEALGDQIWVTVVATRFDGRSAPPRRSAEPTIRRTKDEGRGRGRASGRDELGSLDVPEFLPG